MNASRTMVALALGGVAIAVSVGPGQPLAVAEDETATAGEDGPDAAVRSGPLPHVTFRERGERRLRFVQGAGKRADTTVQLGLEWLKNHQDDTGCWDGVEFSLECRINRCGGPGGAVGDVGVTGAALLAFVGAGETSAAGRYQDVVTRGLEYLRAVQDAEGCFGDRSTPNWLHDHMWAAHAMTEAYGMTGSRAWKDSARRAVSFVLAAENPYLGWGPGVRDGTNNTTMTALAVSVLHASQAAELYGMEGHPTEFKGALAWILKMTEPDTGRVGDVSRGGDGDPADFPQLTGTALTAAALLSRLQAGEDLRLGQDWAEGRALLRDARPRHPATRSLGSDPAEATPDYTLWFWGARAMFHSGSRDWQTWKLPLSERLVATQRRETGRDERGSWDTADDHASHGGRVFVTALACLTLEVPYRTARIGDEDR